MLKDLRPPRIKGAAATIREYVRHGDVQVAMESSILLRGSLVYMVHDDRGPQVFTANGPLVKHEGFECYVGAEQLGAMADSLGVPAFVLYGTWAAKNRTWTLEGIKVRGEHWRHVPQVTPWSPYINFPYTSPLGDWHTGELEQRLQATKNLAGPKGKVMVRCLTPGFLGPRYWFRIQGGADD